MAETYYERLGVDADASVEEIERAYRERLKRTHPDVSDDPAAAKRTRDLIEARRVLTDADERREYDRVGHEAYVGDGVTTAATTTGGTRSSTGTSWGSSRSRANGDRHAATDGASATASASNGTTDRERRRRQNRETRAAWNTTGGVTDGGGGVYATDWRAWKGESGYRVHPTDPSNLGSRLFPIGPSLVMLLVAFGLYPVLLWATLEPAFPLLFNLLLGVCLLVLVGYLASMPPVGVAVFGTWTVFLPTILTLGLGVPAYSPVIGAVVVGTAVPLVLSVAIWAVLRV